MIGYSIRIIGDVNCEYEQNNKPERDNQQGMKVHIYFTSNIGRAWFSWDYPVSKTQLFKISIIITRILFVKLMVIT